MLGSACDGEYPAKHRGLIDLSLLMRFPGPFEVDPARQPAAPLAKWAWRSAVMSPKAYALGFGIGVIGLLIGVSWLVFGPSTISPTQFRELPRCPGNPVPTSSTCYSLVSGQLTGIWGTGGTLYVRVSVRGRPVEPEVMDTALQSVFGRESTVLVRFWKTHVTAVQVPGRSTFAQTWYSPLVQSGLQSGLWPIFGSSAVLLMVGGLGLARTRRWGQGKGTSN